MGTIILISVLLVIASIFYYTFKKPFVPLPIDDSKPLFITECDFEIIYWHYDGRCVVPKPYNKKTFHSEEQTPPTLTMKCERYHFNNLSANGYSTLFQKTRIMRLWEERYKQ